MPKSKTPRKKAAAKKKAAPKKKAADGITTRKTRSGGCQLCGASTGGKGTLCFDCAAQQVEGQTRVADQVMTRIQTGNLSGPVCPYCRADLDWQNVGVTEFETSIYVREKIYYCPGCRAFLGVSSWHDEG